MSECSVEKILSKLSRSLFRGGGAGDGGNGAMVILEAGYNKMYVYDYLYVHCSGVLEVNGSEKSNELPYLYLAY